MVKNNIKSNSKLEKYQSELALKHKHEKLKIGQKLREFNDDVREKNSRSRSKSKKSQPGSSSVERRRKISPQISNPLIIPKENPDPYSLNTQRKRELGLELFDFVPKKGCVTKREKSPALTARKGRKDLENLVYK